MWLKISEQQHDNRRLTFINASYHPPGADENALLNYLINTITTIEDNYINPVILIGGDFNRMKLDDLVMCGLDILDSPPTRGSARLDLFLTNRSDIIDHVSTFKSTVETDHLGLKLCPQNKVPPIRTTQSFRLFSFNGHRKMNTLMSETDFSTLYNIADIDVAANWLEDKLKWCFENAFPLKKVITSSRDPPWITPKTKWLIKQKNTARRRNNIEKAISYDTQIRNAKIDSLKRGSKPWWT